MTRRSLLAFGAALPSVSFGFQNGNRVSPHETASVDLSGQKITITYGRPYLKGRTVGNEIAPFGKVWRLGADEATKITVPTTVRFGRLTLPAGSYALFAIPNPASWTLIVNKVADQWGAFDYDQSKDLGRFEVPVKKSTRPVEEFTISLSSSGTRSATVTFAWGAESVSTTIALA
jgi:hypothetical protein